MTAARYFLLSCAFLALTWARAQSGSLDPAFNGTGTVITPVNDLDVVQQILVQDDQKIIAIGMSFDAVYTARGHVFRYLPDGTPDPTFADNGMFTFELDNEADLYAGVLTPEGKIILAGATTNYQEYRLLLIQLLADGSLDDTFGTNGVVAQSVSVVSPNAEDMAFDVALDAVGNILVSGSSYDANYVRRPIIARFTPSGVLDASFGTDGIASIPVMSAGASSFQGLAVLPDGKIIGAGYFGNNELWTVLLLARFLEDGSLDASFGDAGTVKFNYGNVDDEAEDVQIATDGSILVAGVTVTQTYNYSALLAKFTADGDLDTGFGNGGTVEEDLDSFDYASNLALLPDGSVVMAGSSGDGPPGSFDQIVWKYHADGSPDLDFGDAGHAQPSVDGYYTMINALAVQADGKLLLGGQARTTVNENYFYVGRMLNDLSIGVASITVPDGALAFPNPAAAGSMLTLRLPAGSGPLMHVQLMAPDGRSIPPLRTEKADAQGNDLRVQLPGDLAPGRYQLTVDRAGERFGTSLLLTR